MKYIFLLPISPLFLIARDLRYGGGRGKVGKGQSNGTKTSHRSDPEDTLNESRRSALAELRASADHVSAALDTEFLYCCMLCGESYGCQEDLKRHKELVHQQPNCDNETADETGMSSLTLPHFLPVSKRHGLTM